MCNTTHIPAPPSTPTHALLAGDERVIGIRGLGHLQEGANVDDKDSARQHVQDAVRLANQQQNVRLQLAGIRTGQVPVTIEGGMRHLRALQFHLIGIGEDYIELGEGDRQVEDRMAKLHRHGRTLEWNSELKYFRL